MLVCVIVIDANVQCICAHELVLIDLFSGDRCECAGVCAHAN